MYENWASNLTAKEGRATFVGARSPSSYHTKVRIRTKLTTRLVESPRSSLVRPEDPTRPCPKPDHAHDRTENSRGSASESLSKTTNPRGQGGNRPIRRTSCPSPCS